MLLRGCGVSGGRWQVDEVVSGDEDLPKRNDLGDRRRKHELRVLAGAGLESLDDEIEDDKPGNSDGSEDADVGGGETGESEDEFYEQARQARAEKLAVKSEKYSRVLSIQSEPQTIVDGKRQITTQMEKNRGLTRSRKKLTKNPRKKYKVGMEKVPGVVKGAVMANMSLENELDMSQPHRFFGAPKYFRIYRRTDIKSALLCQHGDVGLTKPFILGLPCFDKMKELDANLPSGVVELFSRSDEVAAAAASAIENTALLPNPSPEGNDLTMSFAENQEVPKSVEAAEPVKGKKLKNNVRHNEQVSMESVKMLKTREALEEKLKQKGIFISTHRQSSVVKEHKLKLLNRQLETFDDFDDDAMDVEGTASGLSGRKILGLSKELSQFTNAATSESKVQSEYEGKTQGLQGGGGNRASDAE
ncbi:hypothetical protein Ancab_012770 [Ancistrocladus abbreviatus]